MGPRSVDASRSTAAARPDARTETLDRIADLLSRLPEDKYFASVNGGDVAPSAALRALDTGSFRVSIYRDDGKSKAAGWVFKATRQTDGDLRVASAGEHLTRRGATEELARFERALRVHMTANGLLPR